MFTLPIELLALFCGLSVFLAILGFMAHSKKAGMFVLIAGFMLFPMIALADNIQLGYSESYHKSINLQELYHLHTWNADRELFATSNTIRALHALDGSSLISHDFFDRIDCIQLFIKKIGSPTGTATVGSFDGNQVLIFTFGTIDVSTLTTSYLLYNFCPAPELHHFIDTDTYLGIRYTGGDNSNKIAVAVNTNNPIGDNILVSRFAGADWVDEPTVDLAGVLYNRAETVEIETVPNLFPFDNLIKVIFGLYSTVLMLLGAIIMRSET